MLHVLFYAVVIDCRPKMHKISYVYSAFNYIELSFVIIESVPTFYTYCSIQIFCLLFVLI